MVGGVGGGEVGEEEREEGEGEDPPCLHPPYVLEALRSLLPGFRYTFPDTNAERFPIPKI